MQTLGERLEEARKRKGISVREAAEATKIRSDYLQKFEANSFDFDLPPLYIRGFLRSYARFLELDAQRVLSEFETLLVDAGRAPRRETRETYGRVEVGGEPGETAPARGNGLGNGLDPVMLKYLMFGGGAVVLLLVILIVVNVLSGGPDTRPAAKPTTAENAAESAAKADIIEPAATAQTVVLTALDTTRVKIVREADESIVFDGTLARGEVRPLKKTGVFRITVEDRTKLRIEVNGRAVDMSGFPWPGNYGRFKLD